MKITIITIKFFQKSIHLKVLILKRKMPLKKSFVCNSCHDVSILSFDINNISIANINIVNYPYIIFGIGTYGHTHVINYSDLRKKSKYLCKILKKIVVVLLHCKSEK